jgi:hypothetical protein
MAVHSQDLLGGGSWRELSRRCPRRSSAPWSRVAGLTDPLQEDLFTPDSSAGRTPLGDVVADDPEPDQQPASVGCHLELMSSMISTVEAGYWGLGPGPGALRDQGHIAGSGLDFRSPTILCLIDCGPGLS